MGVKNYKPTSPARRYYTGYDFKELTKGKKPEKSLLEHQTSTGGRNAHGRITSRFRGGGHKQRYRIIDWRRDKIGVPALVASIEYDPNRTARIALLNYVDGDKRYILAPDGLNVGDKIVASRNADIKPGNSMPLRHIPLGTTIHNIEMRKGKGGQLVRSAGSGAMLMAKDGDYAQLRMPSGEVRAIHQDCQATIGQVSNVDHANISIGKAGRTRWKGVRFPFGPDGRPPPRTGPLPLAIAGRSPNPCPAVFRLIRDPPQRWCAKAAPVRPAPFSFPP